MEDSPLQTGFVSHLGARVEEVGRGYARVSLTVGRHHLNPGGITHGGVILSLADSAFGISANSLGRGLALAAHLTLNFLSPVREGERLTAEGRVIHAGRRSVVVHLTVNNGEGRLVAQGSGLAIRVREGTEERR